MKKTFKKIGALLLVLVMVMSLGGILAYFTDTDTKTNVFEVGKISIDLKEPSWVEQDITPNETVPKDPQVYNDGVSDAFVFIEVVIPYDNLVVAQLDGTKKTQEWVELFSYKLNENWVEVGSAEYNEDDKLSKHVYAYVGGDKNTLQVLKEGETTNTLFDEITVANIVENQGLELTSQDVVINAYGIQTEIIGDEITPDYVWSVIKNQFPELSKVLLPGPEFNKTIPDEATSVVFTDEAAPVEGVSTFSLLRSTPEVVDVSEAQDGGVVAWLEGDTYKVSTQRKMESVIANSDSSKMFLRKSNLVSIDSANLSTQKVTNLLGAFAYCSSLKDAGVSNWDVSKVMNMQQLFGMCTNLSTVDVSKWDTKNVENMSYAFFGCTSLSDLDVSSWNTEKVENMYSAFYQCSSLSTLNTSKWNTKNVNNMGHIFNKCTNLKTLDVSKWNMQNVNDASYMFYNCSNLLTLDVSKWDVENVTTMHSMFNECTNLKTLDVSKWNMQNVNDAGYMFCNCSNLLTLDVSKWDTSNVTNMNSLFWGCINLEELDVSNWDTSKVTDMGYMFGCSKSDMNLKHLDVSNWDVSNVESMKTMFQDCVKLEGLDVSKWNTSSCTNMDHMFYGVGRALQEEIELDVSSFDTSNVTTMNHMFAHSTNTIVKGYENWDVKNVEIFNAIFHSTNNRKFDFSNWTNSKATTLAQMFEGCSYLEEIVGLENFNTSNTLSLQETFAGCSSLTNINVSNLNTSKVINYLSTFSGCSKLENIVGLENWDTSSGTLFNNFLANCNSLTSVNLGNFDTSNAEPYTKDGFNYSGMGDFFKNNNSLEVIIVGENFDFDGNGTATGFVFPTPSVLGSDGNWYNVDTKEAFAPDAIPSNTAATYSAIPQ